MILAVANTKGGVGKTTIALQIAITRVRAGRDVLLIDGDRQGSAMTAATLRAESGKAPPLACVQYAEDRAFRAQVRRQAEKYEEVVIDVGGRDSATMRLALVLADVVLIPLQPRGLDVWALADTALLIAEAQAARDGLKALAVINLADAGPSGDNVDARSALEDFPAITALPAALTRRKAFANAAARGMSVDELDNIDMKASRELSDLMTEVFRYCANSAEIDD